MLKIFVVYAVSGSKADVNLHTVIRIARFIKRTDVAVLSFCNCRKLWSRRQWRKWWIWREEPLLSFCKHAMGKYVYISVKIAVILESSCRS